MGKNKKLLSLFKPIINPMITQITTVSGVEDFMKQLVAEGTNCHPDEDFNNYINFDTDEQVYTDAEAVARNLMMEECFKVCAAAGIDIYDLMQDIYLVETGMDKFIPTSTQADNQSVEFDD
jgi:hypothetical protein